MAADTKDPTDIDKPFRVIEGGGADPRGRVWAKADVDGAFVALAANILRVVRGAGRPSALFQDCNRVIQAAVAYRDAFDTLPSHWKIRERLVFKGEEWGSEAAADTQRAVDRMTRGALQYTASLMAEQVPQTRSGEKEMIDGARLSQRRRPTG